MRYPVSNPRAKGLKHALANKAASWSTDGRNLLRLTTDPARPGPSPGSAAASRPLLPDDAKKAFFQISATIMDRNLENMLQIEDCNTCLTFS